MLVLRDVPDLLCGGKALAMGELWVGVGWGGIEYPVSLVEKECLGGGEELRVDFALGGAVGEV